jgi:hypothetical protein
MKAAFGLRALFFFAGFFAALLTFFFGAFAFLLLAIYALPVVALLERQWLETPSKDEIGV